MGRIHGPVGQRRGGLPKVDGEDLGRLARVRWRDTYGHEPAPADSRPVIARTAGKRGINKLTNENMLTVPMQKVAAIAASTAFPPLNCR
jgi:hypothetical protein